ncbi:MAG: asparaginase domain-containing protein [Halothiobacillaceae bacterium]
MNKTPNDARWLLVNTGGTLNKRYDPLTGQLYVPGDQQAVDRLLAPFADNIPVRIAAPLHKDSLEMTDADRGAIARCISQAPGLPTLVIHGTDTMDRTAAFLSGALPERRIVLTGAMEPLAFGGLEATSNFSLGVGYLFASAESGVFIAMHGLVLPHDRIVKDRQQGVFRPR